MVHSLQTRQKAMIFQQYCLVAECEEQTGIIHTVPFLSGATHRKIKPDHISATPHLSFTFSRSSEASSSVVRIRKCSLDGSAAFFVAEFRTTLLGAEPSSRGALAVFLGFLRVIELILGFLNIAHRIPISRIQQMYDKKPVNPNGGSNTFCRREYAFCRRRSTREKFLPSSLVVLRDINSQVFNPLNVSQRQTLWQGTSTPSSCLSSAARATVRIPKTQDHQGFVWLMGSSCAPHVKFQALGKHVQ